MNESPSEGRKKGTFIAIVAGVAVASALVTALLVNIVERKSEARNAYTELLSLIHI